MHYCLQLDDSTALVAPILEMQASKYSGKSSIVPDFHGPSHPAVAVDAADCFVLGTPSDANFASVCGASAPGWPYRRDLAFL